MLFYGNQKRKKRLINYSTSLINRFDRHALQITILSVMNDRDRVQPRLENREWAYLIKSRLASFFFITINKKKNNNDAPLLTRIRNYSQARSPELSTICSAFYSSVKETICRLFPFSFRRCVLTHFLEVSN